MSFRTSTVQQPRRGYTLGGDLVGVLGEKTRNPLYGAYAIKSRAHVMPEN